MFFEDEDDILRKIDYLSALRTKVRMNAEYSIMSYFTAIRHKY